MNLPSTTNFFVYGTLCRGKCRSRLWPAKPLWIARGWVTGLLYGRDDYPAMIAGDRMHRVLGELWSFESQLEDRITEVLDEIEETNQPGRVNLYDRVVTEVNLLEPPGGVATAQCYCYARDPVQDGFRLIQPDADGYSVWR